MDIGNTPNIFFHCSDHTQYLFECTHPIYVMSFLDLIYERIYLKHKRTIIQHIVTLGYVILIVCILSHNIELLLENNITITFFRMNLIVILFFFIFRKHYHLM